MFWKEQKSSSRNRFGLPESPYGHPTAHCGCQETRVLGWWLDSAFRAGVVADPREDQQKGGNKMEEIFRETSS